MANYRYPLLAWSWAVDPCKVLVMGQDGTDTPLYAAYSNFAFVCKGAPKIIPINWNHSQQIEGLNSVWWSTENTIAGFLDIEALAGKNLSSALDLSKAVRAGSLYAVSPESTIVYEHSNGPVTCIAEARLDALAFMSTEPANKDAHLWEVASVRPDGAYRPPEDYVPENVLQAFGLGFNAFNKQLPKDQQHALYDKTSPPFTVFRP